MKDGAAFRGQPLLLLCGLLISWTALRVMMWQPLTGEEASGFRVAEGARAAVERPEMAFIPDAPFARLVPRRSGAAIRAHFLAPKLQPPAPAPPAGRLAVLLPTIIEPAFRDYASRGIPAAAPALAPLVRPSVALPSRWSADGWLLVRDDSVTPFLSGRPSYGRSQAGALVRYGLAAASPHRPQAYLRASAALAGEREREVALGLSARPLGGLPLRVAVEARLGETDRGTRASPAAYAVTELAPFRLPAGMRAEIYAQAGYVGGAFATAFIDGQAHVERRLATRSGIEVSVGTGAWGWAQEGASRLDLGPTAIVAFRLGKGFGRIAADYRVRVAGNAEPASGPALTVSAGF